MGRRDTPGHPFYNGHPREFVEALQHMTDALDFLDDQGAPAEIGAHLDLAICGLCELLGLSRSEV